MEAQGRGQGRAKKVEEEEALVEFATSLRSSPTSPAGTDVLQAVRKRYVHIQWTIGGADVNHSLMYPLPSLGEYVHW